MWDTRGGVANAMVAGPLPWVRYVFLSDRLLDELTPGEVEAVFGHEVGHVRHGHFFFYAAFMLLSVAALIGGWLVIWPDAGPEAWITVEKILEPGEALRDSWPVDGTTGYDFLNRVSGLFVDPEGEKALTELDAELTGESTDWAEVARAKKHQVMRETMGSDLNRLTALFLAICERRRRYRDYTRHELHEALRDTLASFAVYRTYVRPEPAAVDEDDARRIVEATETARAHRPDLDGELFEFLRDLLPKAAAGFFSDEFDPGNGGGEFLQIDGSRVAILIHAMTKTHDPPLLGQRFSDPVLGLVGGADFCQHAHRGFVRTAV